MARTRSFCPYCARIVPAGQRCACRPRPKRKPTPRDKTRMQREPWRRSYCDPDYLKARQEAIERTKGRCTDCGKLCAWFDGTKVFPAHAGMIPVWMTRAGRDRPFPGMKKAAPVRGAA